ncbi:MAG: hypothetical protein PF482_06515 [Desulfobacteraceae bacterium]|jgi:hypothetical protein|nr:hypothetical protein [Desulfobacteraceae bacterium]
MKCDSCKENVEESEIRDLHGQALCEDCYMDRLSPAKPCDPWAVFTAKSFSKKDGSVVEMTDIQSRILEILQETGGAETGIILERLQIKPADLEREIATLRHMEKVRGELRAGKENTSSMVSCHRKQFLYSL